MPRYSDKRIPKPTQDELWNEFCDLVVKLRTRDQVRRFFCDLFNRSERLMIARRLHVASLLEAGFTYEEIKKLVGGGSAMISRVQRWLEFGRGGLKNAIRTLGDTSRSRLKHKYAHYYRRTKMSL